MQRNAVTVNKLQKNRPRPPPLGGNFRKLFEKTHFFERADFWAAKLENSYPTIFFFLVCAEFQRLRYEFATTVCKTV